MPGLAQICQDKKGPRVAGGILAWHSGCSTVIGVDANDFDYRMLNEVSHRPWPMPTSPWVMTQTWHDLLFAHWPVDEGQLRRKVPAALELDIRDGAAWLGIVPFRMTNVAPRAMPALPWVSAFPELNVRTYVRVADKPGVYFLSLDAGSRVAVGLARTLFNLPYYSAQMDVAVEDEAIRYRSERSATAASRARFAAAYRPVGEPFRAATGSLEHFLTERYCLYSVDDSGRPHRLDIHHRPWTLQQAAATFERNTMAAANGISLPDTLPLLHFARRQDMVAWLPTADTGPSASQLAAARARGGVGG